MVQRSGLMVIVALALVTLAGWGLTRIPTGFIPIEDQGYLMVAVQVPDGASLDRTEMVMDEITRIGLRTPGVERAVAIGTGDQVLQQVTGSPVSGKIVMLISIILFLQWKPGGLFAIRTRSLD